MRSSAAASTAMPASHSNNSIVQKYLRLEFFIRLLAKEKNGHNVAIGKVTYKLLLFYPYTFL
jgi:hypothetical protein